MEDDTFHENPIPVVFEPTKVFNKYIIQNNPNWSYVYKVHCFLFLLGFFFGFFLAKIITF